jgi:hypothetical protein
MPGTPPFIALSVTQKKMSWIQITGFILSGHFWVAMLVGVSCGRPYIHVADCCDNATCQQTYFRSEKICIRAAICG